MVTTDAKLEEIIIRQQLEIERLKAVSEVQNVMGRYEVIHMTPDEIGKTSELFALWRKDCSVEVSLQGAIFGPENIKEYWGVMKAHSIKGAAFFHTLATPIIEVAGNCMTAKAIWASPGFECAIELQKGRSPFNAWCWENMQWILLKIRKQVSGKYGICTGSGL